MDIVALKISPRVTWLERICVVRYHRKAMSYLHDCVAQDLLSFAPWRSTTPTSKHSKKNLSPIYVLLPNSAFHYRISMEGRKEDTLSFQYSKVCPLLHKDPWNSLCLSKDMSSTRRWNTNSVGRTNIEERDKNIMSRVYINLCAKDSRIFTLAAKKSS